MRVIRIFRRLTCSLFLPHDRPNASLICGRRQFRNKTMDCSKSGCTTIWTFVRSNSFPPHGRIACLSFLASCVKRGKRRLSNSKLLARSGCSTRFLTENLPLKARPVGMETPQPERPTIKPMRTQREIEHLEGLCQHLRLTLRPPRL